MYMAVATIIELSLGFKVIQIYYNKNPSNKIVTLVSYIIINLVA